MAYSFQDQLTKDIDWFIFDLNNKPIHFASAGGRLPDYVLENDKVNKRILKEVRKLKPEYRYTINPDLNDIVSFESDYMRFLYLRDFIFMASRGFYSYDKTKLGDFENSLYHLVAWPKVPNISAVSIQIPSTNRDFPIHNEPFNLMEL